ncbi:MAG: hypothetical protein AUJ92_07400 [Armatimonadetes bacterium CG2_30_59_28]|nr:hypothetical protein [Armatimonadota bacterium]OIO95835.1 MAG: hypothetical protein AUJ92_07400 [Armatimonadetes bacterium CG2_30_59_28]PIU64027.1 MAG: hypothetical protein COS85_14040 [Armatimonadetes bacterium CG07_land_8_20_14_0_80_59_28]
MNNPRLAAIQLDTIAQEVNRNVYKALNWARAALEAGARYVFFHEGLTADYFPTPMIHGRPLDRWEVYGFHHLAKQYDSSYSLRLKLHR